MTTSQDTSVRDIVCLNKVSSGFVRITKVVIPIAQVRLVTRVRRSDWSTDHIFATRSSRAYTVAEPSPMYLYAAGLSKLRQNVVGSWQLCLTKVSKGF